MEPERWPYRPDHITIDGDNSDKPELQKLTGVGIIPNNRLQGFQTYISEMLKNPTTVVEFAPDGSLVRTDSTVLVYSLHLPCRIFRDGTDNKYCLDCDNAHAILFRGLTKQKFQEELDKRIRQSGYIQEYKKGDEQHFIQTGCCHDRVILTYDCPLLGYREIVFPIFFEGRAIAAFFVGEIALGTHEDYIRRRQRDFFNRHPELAPDLSEEVLRGYEQWSSEPNNILSEDEYERLIESGCQSIREFEIELQSAVRNRRADYVHEKLENHIHAFQDPLLSIEIAEKKDAELFSFFWRNLSACLEQIVQDYYFRFILIFWKEQSAKDISTPLSVVAQGIHPQASLDFSSTALRYNLSKLKTPPTKETTTSEDPGMFDGLVGFQEPLDNQLLKIRYLPVPFYSSGSLVVLVGYFSDNSAVSEENKSGGVIDESAKNFYAVVRSALSSLLAAQESLRFEMMLRIFGHEVSQVTTGIDGLRVTYLSSPQVLRQIPDKKLSDIDRDLKGFLRLIFLMSKQANLSVNPDQPRQELLPYGDLLFKWKDIYRLEEEKKFLQIYIPNSPTDYQPIHADLRLMEQLLYNLVNNAIKYCYPGTKVILDCQTIQGEDRRCFEISVTNFGIPIDEGINYRFCQRGANVSGQEGLGIGLYLANKIARLHGGELTHTSEEIAPYNVALMETYVNKRIFDAEKRADILSELDRLKRENLYYSIVALNESWELRYGNPYFYTLRNEIDKKTFKVTFKVTIPDEEN